MTMPMLARRALLALVLAVLGMAGLGAAAMTTAKFKVGWSPEWSDPVAESLELLLAAGLGALVGLFASPIVVPCLFRKDLALAFLLTYGLGLLVVVPYTYAQIVFVIWPLDAAIAALLFVCMFSILFHRILPDSVNAMLANHCPRCSYHLRGVVSDRCPECGWRRKDAAASEESAP
jgi:hypothetical protein